MKKAHAFNKEHASFPVSNDCKPDDINKTYAMPPQSHKSLFGGCRWLGLQLRQGSQSLYSGFHDRQSWFFCALNIVSYIRVLAGIQNPFMGNTASRSIAVETTRCLYGITLKTIGAFQ